MNYFQAMKKSKQGWAVSSAESGRVYFPDELQVSWVGDHFVAHASVGITKTEQIGLWRTESASTLSDRQRDRLVRNIVEEGMERYSEDLRRLED